MSAPVYGYLSDRETGLEMLTRLGFRWERPEGAGEYATRQLVRASDGHVMATARTVFDVNHWLSLQCPDLDGANHVRPNEDEDRCPCCGELPL